MGGPFLLDTAARSSPGLQGSAYSEGGDTLRKLTSRAGIWDLQSSLMAQGTEDCLCSHADSSVQKRRELSTSIQPAKACENESVMMSGVI